MGDVRNNKIFVVTGATSGIGLAAVRELVGMGAGVIGIGRSQERCQYVKDCLAKELPQADIAFLYADLSSLAQIRELAQNIKLHLSKTGRAHLDGLVNNAGTVSSWYKATGDGFELQFAVNHLAPFLLSHELLPLLMAAPQGRIVTISSGSHYNTKIKWDDIMLRKSYGCLRAYKQTKLCNVLFSEEFNRKNAGKGRVRAFALDPGLVKTDIGLKGTSGLVKWFWNKRSSGGVEPSKPAKSIRYLLCEDLKNLGSNVYWKDCKPLEPSRYSRNEAHAERLWKLSEKMCGIS